MVVSFINFVQSEDGVMLDFAKNGNLLDDGELVITSLEGSFLETFYSVFSGIQFMLCLEDL